MRYDSALREPGRQAGFTPGDPLKFPTVVYNLIVVVRCTI